MCPFAAGTLSSAASAMCPMHRAGGGGGDGSSAAKVRPRSVPSASPQTNKADKQGGGGGGGQNGYVTKGGGGADSITGSTHVLGCWGDA
jgi:hypothetical protein